MMKHVSSETLNDVDTMFVLHIIEQLTVGTHVGKSALVTGISIEYTCRQSKGNDKAQYTSICSVQCDYKLTARLGARVGADSCTNTCVFI